VLLSLAISQKHIIPILIDEEIIKKFEFFDNITNWHLIVVAGLIGLIVGLIFNKKTRNGTITMLVVLAVVIGGYLGIKNVNFDWFKKEKNKSQVQSQSKPSKNISSSRPYREITVKLRKGKNVLDGNNNSVNYIPRRGQSLLIIPGNGLEMQIGTGKKIKLKVQNDGNGRIENITKNKFYEPLKIFSNKTKEIQIRVCD